MSALHGDIRDRIDAALERMRGDGMAVRAIYLTDRDRNSLDSVRSGEFGMKLHSCGYRDHILRSGKKSMIYSTHGVGVTIPQRLSAKVTVIRADELAA